VAQRLRVDAAGRVEVDVRGTVDDDLVASLVSLGASGIAAYPHYGTVRATLPLAVLERAAALAGVRQIRPAGRPLFSTGPTVSEGDHAHAADLVRTGGGPDGSGVKIGLISDGVDALADRQAAGDLPPVVTVLPGQAGTGAEGMAILEILYDLAPGAQLYFATGITSLESMADNVTALRAAGCDVIVDDVTWLEEGVFQDGAIARAANAVVASGGLYLSAAGNSGNATHGFSGTWEGDFIDSGTTLADGSHIHNFGPSTTNGLTASSQQVTLQWADPLGAAVDDYDLYLLDSTGTTVVDASTTVQDGTQDPLEEVGRQKYGERILIARAAGTARALHLDTAQGRLEVATPGNVFGHNAAAYVLTVAALNVADSSGDLFTANPGSTYPVQVYSSDGPRRLFFNPDGSAITPGNVLFGSGGGRLLRKVDVTAADCVRTGAPGFSLFCGTSAAAPHAAAIAALARSLPSHPSALQVRAALKASAWDMEAVVGPDRDSGSGVVMADRTVSALLQPPAASFYTVTPCRLIDTRRAVGPTGGPNLAPTSTRTFVLTGGCGIPSTARSVAVNLTVVTPTAAGGLTLFPGDEPLGETVSLPFRTGQQRATNAVLKLATDGSGTVTVQSSAAGTVPFLVDVTGYFQ
ncbi:MAG TPA: S8 family serine peptidase, partial [Thermoanaerobaculia bacterium]